MTRLIPPPPRRKFERPFKGSPTALLIAIACALGIGVCLYIVLCASPAHAAATAEDPLGFDDPLVLPNERARQRAAAQPLVRPTPWDTATVADLDESGNMKLNPNYAAGICTFTVGRDKPPRRCAEIAATAPDGTVIICFGAAAQARIRGEAQLP